MRTLPVPRRKELQRLCLTFLILVEAVRIDDDAYRSFNNLVVAIRAFYDYPELAASSVHDIRTTLLDSGVFSDNDKLNEGKARGYFLVNVALAKKAADEVYSAIKAVWDCKIERAVIRRRNSPVKEFH